MQQIAEALVGFVDLARVERGESGALGRIARDAGVHLGQFFLVLAYLRGNLRVIRVRLEILAKLRCTCGVSRVPDQRLAQRRLRVARTLAGKRKYSSAFNRVGLDLSSTAR